MSFRTEFDRIFKRYNSTQRQEQTKNLCRLLQGKAVVLFGAAWIGDFVYERLQSWGITPVCFIDNYASGCTPKGYGPIIRPEEAVLRYPDCIIILTLDRAKEIVYQQMLELGIPSDRIIYDTKHLINVMDMEAFEKHIEGYQWAYDFFDDPISKAIILQRIECYLMGTEVEKSSSPQYFEQGLFELSRQEVFVDGGFFTGDTSEEFIRQVGGEFKKIYGFEPDQYVRDKMPATLLNDRIEIIPKGLYSHEGQVKFVSTEGNSAASGGNILNDETDDHTAGLITVPVTSLDHFFEDKPPELKPTFIKMDIEGSEKEALIGGRETIRCYRPKLAICVYHKPEDIYELPQLIHSLNPKYKYTLRHYAHFYWETVLYAYE